MEENNITHDILVILALLSLIILGIFSISIGIKTVFILDVKLIDIFFSLLGIISGIGLIKSCWEKIKYIK